MNNPENIKQVIVVRKDLFYENDVCTHGGKMSAQVAHAAMKPFFDRMIPYVDPMSGEMWANTYLIEMTPEMAAWKDGLFTKIVPYVKSEEKLLKIYQQAQELGLPTSLITDSGLTLFNGVPTNTCISIGPDKSERIDVITRKLQLLK